MKKQILLLASSVFLSVGMINAQKIGLLTATPQAPVHISSSGQVNTPGGLLVLGDTSEAHMELDFDILQASYGNGTLPLKLQPYGGNVGINTSFPAAPFHVGSSGQVNTPGGLMLLGYPGEGHLIMDFDRVQALYGVSGFLPLSIQPSGGNVNIGNGMIFADRANNFVGINTISPNTELQLHGEMQLTTSGISTLQKDKISINGTLEDAATVGIGWMKSAINDPAEIYYKSRGAHRWFINELANVNTPDMILTPTGDLGIGPSVPNGTLHLTSNYFATLANKGFFQMGATTSTNIVMDNNEIQARNNGGSAVLYLNYWGGNLSLCETTSGKVGIGTINADSKLQILDGVDASVSSHGYMVAGPISGANVVIDDNEIMARNNASYSPLYLQNDGGNLLLCGSGTGRVGIGVPTEADMPSSDFLLAVDGKIISEEVRVEMSGNWPDYVFDDGYSLTPLDKLKEEIKQAGHLPGMPSADQVEKEGFELGDMQRRLLEKVEELTLYVLELHQSNLELKREIEVLKSK